MTLIGFAIVVLLIVCLALILMNALIVPRIIMFWIEIPASLLVLKAMNYLLIICIFRNFNFYRKCNQC